MKHLITVLHKLMIVCSMVVAASCAEKHPETPSKKTIEEGIVETAKTNLSSVERLFNEKRIPKIISEKDIAKEIVTAQQKQFPGSEVIAWKVYPEVIFEMNKDTLVVYEVESPSVHTVIFKFNNEVQEAKYDRNGKLLEISRLISDENIPPAVNKAIQEGEYKDWKVLSEKQEVDNVIEREKVYRIELMNGKEKRVLYFKKDGEIAKVLSAI